jgi:hypothetical protein
MFPGKSCRKSATDAAASALLHYAAHLGKSHVRRHLLAFSTSQSQTTTFKDNGRKGEYES